VATKLQVITEFAQQLSVDLSSRQGFWQDYLRTASRIYKYPFQEQLLIYGQKPDATACAPTEIWNRRMGRWVNRGAKGIALIDDSGPRVRLKYVFDVSDTHPGRYRSLLPRLWKMQPEHEVYVWDSLKNTFGELEDSGDSFAEKIISISESVAMDNLPDYLDELMQVKQGSFLEELDELNIAARLRSLLANSVAYTIMARCGIEADYYFTQEDFQKIFEFNTFDTVSVLGTATSDISKMVLLEIGRTVDRLDREQKFAKDSEIGYSATKEVDSHKQESGKEAERNGREFDLHHTGRVSISKPDPARAGGNAAGQVRADAPEVSEGESEGDLQPPAAVRETGGASGGDRPDSHANGGTAGQPDGRSAGRERGTETGRPDEVGGADEHHSQWSRGSSSEERGISVTQQEADSEKQTLPPLLFENAVSQQAIDTILCIGSNDDDSPLRIVGQYRKDKPTAENVVFLKKEFSVEGRGVYVGDTAISSWSDETGISIAEGKTVLNNPNRTHLTWEQVDRRIRQLLKLGRFMPQSELDKVDEYERNRIAKLIVNINHDEFINIPKEEKAPLYEVFHGYPEEYNAVTAQLGTPEGLADNIRYLENGIRLMEEYPSYRRYHDVPAVLQELNDLQNGFLTFTAQQQSEMPPKMFITQDDVDVELRDGSNVENSKFRIYQYFLNESDPNERAAFLREEYGTGGSSGGRYMHKDYDSKGLRFSRGSLIMPYDKIVLTWNKAAKRIGELIDSGQFMTEQEMAQIPDYLKRVLARRIYNFYSDQPDDVPKPYPEGVYHYEGERIIRPQLDIAERRTDILIGMEAVMQKIRPEDRTYESKAQTLDAMRALNAGIYDIRYTFPKRVSRYAAARQEKTVPPWKPDQNAVYDLKLGTEVYLGTTKYSIHTLGTDYVLLSEVDAPLFTTQMPREEFDRKMRESPLNDPLKRTVSKEKSVPEVPPEEPAVEVVKTAPEPTEELPVPPKPKRNAANVSNMLCPEIPRAQRHDYRITNDALGHGGPKAKFKANVEAIRTLQKIEAENRLATPKEQEILSGYVGWGGLAQAFEEHNSSWANEYT